MTENHLKGNIPLHGPPPGTGARSVLSRELVRTEQPCWLKASHEVWEQVYQIEEERFQLYLIRLKSCKVKVKLYEWEVNIAGYGLCRAIILLDLKTGKRMVIITNDKTRSLREVAELMLQRWSQENFFKVMMARYNLDYVPGHQFKPAQKDPLVVNPRLKELRRLKARLQALKRKLESELAHKLLARKRDQVTLQDHKDDHDKCVPSRAWSAGLSG